MIWFIWGMLGGFFLGAAGMTIIAVHLIIGSPEYTEENEDEGDWS